MMCLNKYVPLSLRDSVRLIMLRNVILLLNKFAVLSRSVCVLWKLVENVTW